MPIYNHQGDSDFRTPSALATTPLLPRRVLVVGGCLLRGPRSLEAFWRVARGWRRAQRQRQWIMSRRKTSDSELARWFQFEPAAMAAPDADAIPYLASVSAE